MEAIETLALAKAVKDAAAKKAREELAVGKHSVDFTVRVSGELTVGEDESYTPTVKVPFKAALALFVRYSGVTGDAALNALVKAFTEAVEADGDTVAALEASADLVAAEARLNAALGELPKATRKGKVLTKLVVEAVEDDAE